MLPINSGGHTASQTFVLENLRKYYPTPTVFAKSTWDIIERFWSLVLSYTDELLRSKYSVFGSKKGLLPVCNILIFFPLILRFILLLTSTTANILVSFFYATDTRNDSVVYDSL